MRELGHGTGSYVSFEEVSRTKFESEGRVQMSPKIWVMSFPQDFFDYGFPMG